MFREAAEAPAVVARQLALNAERLAALGARLRERRPSIVLTCGRGSSDHAGTFAKYLIETRTGVPTTSAAPSVSSVYGSAAQLDGALCLAISQSGQSPDILSAAQTAKDAGAEVVAMVNVEDSPLAQLAHVVAPLAAGPETSVAATKSYIAALVDIVHLVAHWTEDAELLAALQTLPRLLGRAWSLDWSPAAERLTPARHLYVIGRGLGYGIAQEAALKLKETCGLHAEPFSAAEVKHGPMALVGEGFPVLMFSQSDETRGSVEALIEEFTARGAAVISAGAVGSRAYPLPTLTAHPVLEPILLIQSFYRAANALSLARGHDPDHPPHLRKVTETV